MLRMTDGEVFPQPVQPRSSRVPEKVPDPTEKSRLNAPVEVFVGPECPTPFVEITSPY
jgi:hypothetical protein